jgi:hypothetical protein
VGGDDSIRIAGVPTLPRVEGESMPIIRQTVDRAKLNPALVLPFELRLPDYEMAMEDVYDFFYDVNRGLVE